MGSATTPESCSVKSMAPDGWRLVVASPANVDMASIAALAHGLGCHVAHLAKAIYQSPSVLASGLTVEQQADLIEVCALVGLDAVGQPDCEPFEADPERFDVAVHVVDPAAIPHCVEVVAAVVGVTPSQAYQMLATPPGLVIGDVSGAAVAALRARFGAGVEVSVAHTGAGPFDVFVAQTAPRSTEIESLCGTTRGLVRLGLDHDAASRALKRCPRGSVQLIARDLIRFDVVLTGVQHSPNEHVVGWLMEHFDVDPGNVEMLLQHVPIALAEAVISDQAAQYASDAQQLGLLLALEPAGFGRFAIDVVHTQNQRAVAGVLENFQLPTPSAFPVTVATGLSDLDARWLAYQLELAGATISFKECR